jgi:ATP-dependent helicase HrpA
MRDMALYARNLPEPWMNLPSLAAAGDINDEIIATALRRLCVDGQVPVRTQEEFELRYDQCRTQLVQAADELAEQTLTVLRDYHGLQMSVKGKQSLRMAATLSDIQFQIRHLFYQGFIGQTPGQWWLRLPRYVQAIRLRWERAAADPGRDRARQLQVNQLLQDCVNLMQKNGASVRTDSELETYRWLLEEFRISLFAQELKTVQPVSAERLGKLWKDIGRRY